MNTEEIVNRVCEEVKQQLYGQGSRVKDSVPTAKKIVETEEVRIQAILDAGACRLSSEPGVRECKLAISHLIDHTVLKPETSEDQIYQLCAEAKEMGFASVCVNPTWVALCSELLRDSPVRVCTVVGFPLGANTIETKIFETQDALRHGATEIDMVINIGALKSGDFEKVEDDIRGVVYTARPTAIVKVIIETALLTDEEKIKACVLAKAAGAHFVKTSTGFSTAGARIEDIWLMREVVGPKMGVKASGGIREFEFARDLVLAGASRIGASAGIKIVGN